MATCPTCLTLLQVLVERDEDAEAEMMQQAVELAVLSTLSHPHVVQVRQQQHGGQNTAAWWSKHSSVVVKTQQRDTHVHLRG